MNVLKLLPVMGALLAGSCAVMVNSPDEKKTPVVQRINLQTRYYFPFECNSNWWSFTETSGNKLDIQVTDTISDDFIMYYRVSFREHQVDTTDDWFRRIRGDIQFGASLSGTYNQFLPAQLDSANGSFLCGTNRVRYSYLDSTIVNGFVFRKVLVLKYTVPVVHGFEEITLAESHGIIQMKDYNGRWLVNYTLDSCSINNSIKRY